MRATTGLAAAAAMLLLPASGALAQMPIISHGFETTTEGWNAMGDNAHLSITNDAANVKSGKGALKYEYKLAKGEMDILMLPTPSQALAKMKSLHFSIKSDHTAPFIMSLSEKDGGRYNAVFTVSANKWQTVELAASDFVLAEDKNDPKDPDGKLDLEQVENIGIVDLGMFFAQADNPEMAALFGIKLGACTAYFDDFVVTNEPLLPSSSTLNGDFHVDTFARPQSSWVGIGVLGVSVASGKPLEGKGIKIDYHQTPMKPAGVFRSIQKGKLTGATKLVFDAASTRAATLVIQVEEVSGGKYNTTIMVPAGGVAKTYELAFSNFNAAEDSKDDNGKLDLDQVKQILVLDASGFLESADSDNTLWLGVVRAVGAK